MAGPALGALVAEPLFLLADSAFVGHVSTDALAGLGIASTILTTVVGLSVFLAYSTTASVSRALGAGRQTEALSKGIDACWLALLVGLLCMAVLLPGSGLIVNLFGPTSAVGHEATTYLRISALGLPAMLAVLAATGLVRGLQDTRTPFLVAGVGAAVNVPLNWAFVFPAGLGIAGSALGTVLVQWGMAICLLAVVIRSARPKGVSLRLRHADVTSAWRESVPMLIRTLCLRIVLITMTVAALRLGAVQLAAHQAAMSVFNLVTMALDALAIAGQALTGRMLGAGDRAGVHAVTRRLMLWGVCGGTLVALVMLASSFLLPDIFSPDPAVRANLRAVLFVLLLAQPLAGYVFVLDGVLMGAGDAPYLAKAAAITLAVFLPATVAISALLPGGLWALVGLWCSFCFVFMTVRAVTLGLRVRTDAWMQLH